MRGVLAQRQLVLAGTALLGIVLALALEHRVSGSEPARPAVQPVVASLAGWNRALAGVRPGPRRRSDCGWLLGPATLGVAHPVLPCGAKIFIAFRNRRVLTQVVDRGPRGPGREFELTPALGRKLGLHGLQPIRWTFARG